MTDPTYDVVEYRFQNDDDGDENTATFAADLNTSISMQTGTANRLRIRVQTLNDNNKVSNVTWQWEYNKNSTGWNDITTGSSNIQAIASTNVGVVEGDPLSNQLTTRGTFDGDGNITVDGLGTTYNHAANAYAEQALVFYIVDADVANGNSIEIRPYSSGDGFTVSYTNTPTLTVLKGTDTSYWTPAYIRGGVNTSDNQPAYARGSLPASDQQAAYIAGSLAASDSQPAYTHGSEVASDNQPAYTAGALSANDNQPVYLEGALGSSGNQPAYIAGIDTITGNQSAYLEGVYYVAFEYDNFNDNSRDTSKWNLGSTDIGADNASVTALEQNNRLEIQPLDSTAGNNYYGFKSVDLYNLNLSAAFVEVTQLHQAALANTQFRLQSGNTDGDYLLGFEVENTTIYFQYRDDTSWNQTNTTYNSTNHRWWRVRHDYEGSNIEWQTSPDGLIWTTQRTVAESTITSAGIDIEAMRIHLAAGTWGSVSSPSATYFDNFNYHPEVPRKEDWTSWPDNHPVVVPHGVTETTDWDYILWGAESPANIIKFGSMFIMYYTGANYYAGDPDYTPANRALGIATSWDGFNWTKYASNPIITYSDYPTVEEGVAGACAIVIGGTIHLYYGAIKATTPVLVDIDIRYRKSTDGFTYTDDTLIYSVSGDEFQTLFVFHDGTNYHLYIKENLGSRATGPIYRLSGTNPTSLSLQGTVLSEYSGMSKAQDPGTATVSDSDILVVSMEKRLPYEHPKAQIRVIEKTSPGSISDMMHQWQWGGWNDGTANPSIFYDAHNGIWHLYHQSGGNILHTWSGDQLAVSGLLAYMRGQASASDNLAAYIAGTQAASSQLAGYVEGLYQPLPVTEPWTGSNDDPWRISHWVTEIIE